MSFLPVSKQDMIDRGIEQLDFVYVIGDAYVDHPSFGHAIISRVLESHGYTVGIISQPDWKDDNSINILGEPRLGFLVMGGIWILWLIIIMYLKSIEQWMHIRRVVKSEKDRTMQR